MERTTCLKQSKDVEFQDVFYTVTDRKYFLKSGINRLILEGVSGSFRNGELSAIMGPSGAGKSSLLNALSGYRTSGVGGHIKINRADSCYITQEDHHQLLLTVEELMNLSCDLKLEDGKRKEETITETLENLNLNHRRNVTADKLSGGERKRLSIALELVANPNIFFLDEPTSGLDDVTAAQCIRLLSKMAKQGRTIVCTIHQPSATIFNYFDKIFVLAKGQCVYQGRPDAVIPFLRHIDLECPKYYSPSDYIIELCDTEDTKVITQLSNLTDNGKLIYVPAQISESTIETNGSISDNLIKSVSYNSIKHSNHFHQAITTFFIDEPKVSGFHNFINNSVTSPDGTLVGGVTALYEQMKAFSKRIQQTERQEISSFKQFSVLLRVMVLKILRARIPLIIQLSHHVIVGLFFGLIFYKLGNKGDRMFDHLKFCIAIILMIAYTQVMVPILSFPSEVKIVKKETFNRWYTLMPYYIALTISRIPFQVIFNVAFLSITYWMSGLPDEWWRFCLFVAIGLMISFVAEGMGLAIGATFSITNGSAVGPLVIAPFMGLAVYGFDFAAKIPYAMNLLMKLSYIRVGVVSLVLTVFGFNRDELECDEIYCHFSDPKVLIKFLDIERVSMAQQFALLSLLMIFFRTLLYLSLRKRCGT
ncbi:ATP-binding cassette sub-family G member 1 [Teleopsis dalmanni]|uniref:ATP-binding cassette sub-family G member 1 n=1 Tax=Teleopsis dalmanni TaxID=139649 RepID=UPI0018CEA528|nr:ATP-binding cassette sub-family G member 1 [Teleopsis dalmanni]XP_037935776.1 ATP-binding cassette sub-family G member 1 [Teleopsis dalmanni]